jgi:hypothetical protein
MSARRLDSGQSCHFRLCQLDAHLWMRVRQPGPDPGAAWKAVSGIGLAAGLSAKYQQFVVDEAVLDNGYAAAISGGPPTSLKGALSKLSTDCHKEGQTARPELIDLSRAAASLLSNASET